MKPKVKPIEDVSRDIQGRCISVFLPDNDELIALYLAQSFKYLASPNYYYDTGNAVENARIFERFMILNNLDELSPDCRIMPENDVYVVSPECVGQVKQFALDSPPLAHLRCDGRQYHRDDYPQLYNAISPVFRNGDHFSVPDLRDRIVYGSSGLSAIGGIVGTNSRKVADSELPSHSHELNLETENADAPHDHGGETLSGKSTFYRTVGNAGTSALNNHVTGFSAGSTIDRTDTNYPLRLHRHTIESDDATHRHSVYGATDVYPVEPQTAMDMRQESLTLNYFICAGSVKASDLDMIFLRRNDNKIEQTRNGGADWEYLFDACDCDSSAPNNPLDGSAVTWPVVNVAQSQVVSIGNDVLSGTYDSGDFGENSTYSNDDIETAICYLLYVYVTTILKSIEDSYDGKASIDYCQAERVGAIVGGLGAFGGAINGGLIKLPFLIPLAPYLIKAAAALAIVLAICEVAESIVEEISKDPDAITDADAIKEVVCYMSNTINAPLNFAQWQNSLNGFDGSSRGNLIAEVIRPTLADAAVYGTWVGDLQDYVDAASTATEPCLCDDSPPVDLCGGFDRNWNNTPLEPLLPSGWSLGTSDLAMYGSSAVVQRQVSGLGQGEFITTSFDQTTVLRYDFQAAPCNIQTVKIEMRNDVGGSMNFAVFKVLGSQVAQLDYFTRGGTGSSIDIELFAQNIGQVDAIIIRAWSGSSRIKRVTVT